MYSLLKPFCRECGGAGYLTDRGDRREITFPCPECDPRKQPPKEEKCPKVQK